MLHRLFVLLLLAGTAATFPAPAQAAVCSGTSGVTVIVQFPDGHTETGCAAGDPKDGYEALGDAGFSFAYVQGQPGAICQIKGVPAPNKCWGTTYWSYWHAKRGGSWNWSNVGASYNPAPGSVEGWRFGDGKAGPSMDPPAAVSKPKPKPKPTPSPRPTVASKPTTAPGETPTLTPTATPTGKATPIPTASATTSATSTPTPTASESADAASVSPASAPLTQPDDGGASWVWGVVLVGVLGLAAIAEAFRRRRS